MRNPMVTSKMATMDIRQKLKTTLDAVFEGFQLWHCAKIAVTKNLRVDIFVMMRQLQ